MLASVALSYPAIARAFDDEVNVRDPVAEVLELES
jgi:hypothetical protein